MRKVKGVGRRFATIAVKKAGLDVTRRAGELTEDEIEKIVDVINNPLNYDLPTWMLNRRRDPVDGTTSQQVANNWDIKIREDLEKMKKMKLYRGLRHYFGYKVRGQHTKSTGRRGNIVGVAKKK